MGHARVFAVNEVPIREYATTNGVDDRLKIEVGKQILSLTMDGPFHCDTRLLPLFDAKPTFVPFRSFHSTDLEFMIWTGLQFHHLRDVKASMFRCLQHLDTLLGTANRVSPLTEDEYEIALARGKFDSPLASQGSQSFFQIYHDFTRDYERTPPEKWPSHEVGTAVLDLLFSDWNRSATILNCGNAIQRVCTLLNPEMCVLVWSGNCLQTISELRDSTVERIEKFLDEKPNRT